MENRLQTTEETKTQIHERPVPEVVVYLIHFNAPEWLSSAIQSLNSSNGCSVKIGVIDNSASLDANSVPAAVRLIEPGDNTGYTGGANRALADCRIHYPAATEVVIAAHDAHVETQTLALLHASLAADPSIGIAYPHLLEPAATFGGTWDGRRATMITDPNMSQDAVWGSGTLMMLRMACVDDVGCFDEGFSSYAEDVDYGLRATDAGWKVHVDNRAAAWGLGSASPLAPRLIAVNSVRLRVKRSGWAALIPALAEQAFALTRSLAVAVGYGKQSAESRVRARESARNRAQILRQILTDLPSWHQTGVAREARR